LIWQVGKGDRVQIGLDPWVDIKGRHGLSPQRILNLRGKGYYMLRRVVKWPRSTIRLQEWLTWRELGLGEENAIKRQIFINYLKDSNVRIREEDDWLGWSLNPSRVYIYQK